MVFLSSAVRCLKRPFKQSRFVDSLRILVKGGSGGHGLPKLGGVGGDGGNILVEGRPDVTLKDIAQRFPTRRVVAGHGENSSRNRILGAKGHNLTVEVPVGTTIYNETGQNLGNRGNLLLIITHVNNGEINKEGEKVQVAVGGAGGSKNTGFSGLRGEKFVMTLDLKLIADVGLVGLPNAGKSSLLTILSKANPKIASYPFTTIQPHIGTLMYSDLRQITMADLPGLIEGAHANVGMGHRFLKHVERTKLLLLVVDVSGFQLGPKYKKRSCIETLILLNKELELYKKELLEKPAILVVNKMDLPDAGKLFKDLHSAAQDLQAAFHRVPDSFKPEKPLTFNRILSVSALKKNPEETEILMSTIRQVLDETAAEEGDAEIELFQKIDKEYCRTGPALI